MTVYVQATDNSGCVWRSRATAVGDGVSRVGRSASGGGVGVCGGVLERRSSSTTTTTTTTPLRRQQQQQQLLRRQDDDDEGVRVVTSAAVCRRRGSSRPYGECVARRKLREVRVGGGGAVR